MNGPTTLQRNLIRLWIYTPVALLVGLVLAIEDIELPGILGGLGIAVLLAVFIRWFETKFPMHATIEGQRRSLVSNLVGTTFLIAVINTLKDHDSFFLNLAFGFFAFMIVAPFFAFFDLPTRFRSPFRRAKKLPN